MIYFVKINAAQFSPEQFAQLEQLPLEQSAKDAVPQEVLYRPPCWVLHNCRGPFHRVDPGHQSCNDLAGSLEEALIIPEGGRGGGGRGLKRGEGIMGRHAWGNTLGLGRFRGDVSDESGGFGDGERKA